MARSSCSAPAPTCHPRLQRENQNGCHAARAPSTSVWSWASAGETSPTRPSTRAHSQSRWDGSHPKPPNAPTARLVPNEVASVSPVAAAIDGGGGSDGGGGRDGGADDG